MKQIIEYHNIVIQYGAKYLYIFYIDDMIYKLAGKKEATYEKAI